MIQTSGWQTIRDYFFEYKTPTLEVMKVKIDELENDILKVCSRWTKKRVGD